ncbi:uncharacterized protein LOC100632656 precursor [Amphimedon queenslandica]|uniref:Delta-like protein n=1 Tax=Amphimedon queenslandica TaxID=400682 RepID=F6JTI8_AMPQE|nr:uncharacterized protein LOC100632656 precursor [Amphimedon queenslandica]ADU54208.1 Delta3 [Amphimedon queenslandica]|eukprot:NP_001292179.1 uncharacterized protein LOC100632656 precursor [Amphimedon queenslandica]
MNGWLLLPCLSLLSHLCTGRYTLLVKAVQYHNPDNQDWNDGCCDWPCSNNCDLYFKFCIRNKGLSASNINNCWDSVQTYGDVSTNNYYFPNYGELYPGARIWNDLTFNRNEPWPGSVQVLVESLDADDNADDLIDRNAFNLDLSPNGQWSNELYANGYYDRAQFKIRVRLFCQQNYYGSNCNVYCVQQNDDTNGHYTCGSDGAKICNNGYTNPSGNCLTPICSSGCSSQNGYCNVPGECLCNTGWTGTNCNECIPKSGCSTSHGYCNVANECLCETGYGGSLCTEDHDVCGHEAPCLRGGTCTNIIPDGFRCSCPPGYNGSRCETEVNECDPRPCQNGGTCFDRVNDYYCECAAGWTGTQCQTNIDDCQSSPCLNNGTCGDLVNGYQCSCVTGFIGPNCEGHHCHSTPCSNNGTCVQVTSNDIGYTCVCQPGYTGVNCTKEIDECSSAPCYNNATCIDALADYSCSCLPGFTGKDCQVNIDECVRAQCSVHSICMDEVNGYQCICDIGYTGRYCDTKIDYCSPPPCLNNGTCNSYPGYYTCNCQEGFNGTECDNNIDDCVSDPCLNGGTCNDIIRGFTCTCPIGWTGLVCSTVVSACDPNPCPTDYICVDNTSATYGYNYYCEHCSEYDSCTFYGAPSPSPNPNSGAVTGNSNGGVGMLVGVSVGGALLSCCFAMIIVGCCCYLCRKKTQMKKFEIPIEGSHFSDNPTYIPPELLQSTTLDHSASPQYGTSAQKLYGKGKKGRPLSPQKDGYELLDQSGDTTSSLRSTVRSGSLLLTGVYDKLKHDNIYTETDGLNNTGKGDFDEESFPPLKGTDTISPYDRLPFQEPTTPAYDSIGTSDDQGANHYERISSSPICTSPSLNTPYQDASIYATIPANENNYEPLPGSNDNNK